MAPTFLGDLVHVRELGKGRIEYVHKDGSSTIGGLVSNAEAKMAFVLEKNVQKFFRVFPIEIVGFLTITFPPNVQKPKQASEIFNSFRTNFLSKITQAYIKVIEPHKDRRPHYHLLVALNKDIRTGFDWESQQLAVMEYRINGRSTLHRKLTKQYSSSASASLRKLWRELRQAQKKYGLGRTELLPIRKSEEAAAKYIAKYINKAAAYRTGDWKGVRLVDYSRHFEKEATCKFTWVEAAKSRRDYLAEIASILKISDLEGMEKVFGRNWSQKLLLCQAGELSPKEAISFMEFR